jgi:dTDP-glucose pyrophosphorylase
MTDRIIIPCNMPLSKALEVLEESPVKTLFLTDTENKLCGSLTDGDVRRWILKTGDIKGIAMDACFPQPFTLRNPVDRQSAMITMKEKHLFAVPVVDETGRIESVISIEELKGDSFTGSNALAGLDVVIMAGGKGTRLDPFTRILPKPLIPIGHQPVIERIMEEFSRFGADHFHISVNHQARLIKAYFEDQDYPYKISFLEEHMPLGTAGALRMLQGKTGDDLMVSNCDVIIRSDYGDMLQFHRKGNFAITLVAALHNISVPYGVCELNEKGHLSHITEKPEFNMLINSGMYLMKSSCLRMIPENRLFHITDLIDAIVKEEMTVGVFPIPQSAYHDIGQWDVYHNSLSNLL